MKFEYIQYVILILFIFNV